MPDDAERGSVRLSGDEFDLPRCRITRVIFEPRERLRTLLRGTVRPSETGTVTQLPLHGGHLPMRLIDLGDVLPDPWSTEPEHDEQDQHELDPAETGWDEVESDRL
jgi:hypothetical protein